MPFFRGQEIKRAPKRPQPPESAFGVRIAGERQSVPIHHVSRETLNRPLLTHVVGEVVLRLRGVILSRAARRARRKQRMRLRKKRGWR